MKPAMPDEPRDLSALGFDFGLKRTGVAIGQTITSTASPVTTVVSKEKGQANFLELDKLVTEWKPDALVVGIPLNMDGSEQPLTQAAKTFANSLKKRYHLPVYGVDERLSTIEAKEQLFEKGGYRKLKSNEIDHYAAVLILNTWLTTENKEELRI